MPLLLTGFTTGISVSMFLLVLDYTSRALAPSIPAPLLAFLSIPAACLLVRILSDSKKTGSGVDRFLETYHLRHGMASLRSTAVSAVSSLVTMALGGSAGPEGPGLTMGAGIGSWMARRFGLDPEKMKRLYINGAAAGIAAIFRAPLTGTVFALEIPYMYDVETGVFVSSLVAVVVSYTSTVLLLGTERLFPFQSATIEITPALLANSVAVGLISAAVSLVFISIFRAMKAQANRRDSLLVPLVGGGALAAIAVFFPEVLGTDFGVISGAGSGAVQLSLSLAIALLVMKMIATSVTLSTGGSGGLFMPCIFLGVMLGEAYSVATGQPDRAVMIAAAVAGVFAATNKALLTSILLVGETFGPVVLLPSIVAAAISFLITKDRSIHEHQLLRRITKKEMALGMFGHRMGNRLKEIHIERVMVPKPSAIDSNATVGEALDTLKRLGYRVMPVVSGRAYIGYVTLDVLLVEEKGKPVSEVVVFSDPVMPEETLDRLVMRMLNTEETHVYVTDAESNLLGVITQSDIIRSVFELGAQ
ncbi:MAG: chloride channel protein [Candidatus Methanosuratincola sp.]|nr:chloride channel protein [Candidatus Methanosuratincola sp.]